VVPSASRPLLTQFLEELMHIGGLLVNRRDGLWREVVDLDDLGHRLLRSGKLLALALGNDALLHGFPPVMNAGRAHLLPGLFRASDEKKCFSQPRTATIIVTVRHIRGQAVARRRRLQHELGTTMHEPIGGPEHARAERLDEEFQETCDETVWQ